MPQKFRDWLAGHPNWALALATIAVFAPFLAKPFNIDDPLFVWGAGQVQLHPANPFGFDVNWYDTAEPMWSVTENPPLACYFIALVATIFGRSETALHCAFLIPAIAAVLGTHRLAKVFCSRPWLAALATLLTPVFLVSGTTVMCDMLLLAFWIWALVFWVEGLERTDSWRLTFAALLVSLAFLTKYFGICLLPLLAVHGAARMRRRGKWLLFLLPPLAVMVAYQSAMFALYGQELFTAAAGYASFARDFFGFSKPLMCLTALVFTGGCAATAVLFAPLLWSRRTLVIFCAAAGLAAAALFSAGHAALPGAFAGLAVKIQFIFWLAGGISVLTLAVADFFRRRDAASLLLGLWVTGTFVFAAFFNWSVNGRSLLPLVPAVAILLVCRLEQNQVAPRRLAVPLTAAALLALLVGRADFLQAMAVRENVTQILIKHLRTPGPVWFQGHWGFQFYMQSFGALPLDLKHPGLRPGDKMVVPQANTDLKALNPETTVLLDTVTTGEPGWLSTWNQKTGAGFYASSGGPLPFAFGLAPPEQSLVYQLKPVVAP